MSAIRPSSTPKMATGKKTIRLGLARSEMRHP